MTSLSSTFAIDESVFAGAGELPSVSGGGPAPSPCDSSARAEPGAAERGRDRYRTVREHDLRGSSRSGRPEGFAFNPGI
jgi:hypothetical protein